MKIAYFDCFSGISGDMLLGSMIDAGLDIKYIEDEIKKLGLDSVEIKAEKTVKQNIASTKFTVHYASQKHHRHLEDIYAILDKSAIDNNTKKKAREVFHKIAVAEAKIHDMPPEKVHFHEIGAVDTIVDVVGALAGFRVLGIDKITCSRLNVGSGFVRFSHGKFPVPAPATAEILKEVPVYSTDSRGELVTPTGAAIITTLCKDFGDVPPMKISSIGYGSGTSDFEHPNVLRVYTGETAGEKGGKVVEVIETNIDDMNPQWYDHIIEKLYLQGALEVFLTNVQMKKNRPGIMLTVLADPENKKKLLEIIFSETTSIGARTRRESREILERETKDFNTPYGKVRAKITNYRGNPVNIKVEYDDLKRISLEKELPLKQVAAEISKHLGF